MKRKNAWLLFFAITSFLSGCGKKEVMYTVPASTGTREPQVVNQIPAEGNRTIPVTESR